MVKISITKEIDIDVSLVKNGNDEVWFVVTIMGNEYCIGGINSDGNAWFDKEVIKDAGL
jgi:hypothetical protein